MEATTRKRVLGALFALAVANAVLFLALLGETTGWHGARGGAYIAVAAGFAAGFGVLTLVRDRFPRTTLLAAVLTVCTYYIVGLPSIGVVLPLLVILTATTLAGERTFALVTVGALFIIASYFRLRDGEAVASVLGYELLSNIVLVALAVALAEVIRTRHALQRSQEHSTRMAVEAAHAEADRLQEKDRTRIARELHDELGHSLAIVSLHANAVSEQVADDDPAAESAGHLRGASSQAMEQLRRAVRAIGSPAGHRGDPGALADAATVTEIEIHRIVRRVRAAGLSVDVVSDHAPVSAAVAGMAVSIVQEATTNALRHSAPDHIGIAITGGRATGTIGVIGASDDAEVLRIRVLNDRVEQSTACEVTGGAGLEGLRARAAELGGDLTWGRRDRGMFVVDATLPIGRDDGGVR